MTEQDHIILSLVRQREQALNALAQAEAAVAMLRAKLKEFEPKTGPQEEPSPEPGEAHGD